MKEAVLFSMFICMCFLAIYSGFSRDNIKFELDQLKQEAYERGYMTQCVGKTGFYWECE